MTEVSRATGTLVYFCDPHSPGQRGTNEHTDRLLRDDFPKRTDLSAYRPSTLLSVANELDQRPRAVLD